MIAPADETIISASSIVPAAAGTSISDSFDVTTLQDAFAPRRARSDNAIQTPRQDQQK